MKAITKKHILVAIIIILTTATVVYAGFRMQKNIFWDELITHPALDELAKGYNNMTSLF